MTFPGFQDENRTLSISHLCKLTDGKGHFQATAAERQTLQLDQPERLVLGFEALNGTRDFPRDMCDTWDLTFKQETEMGLCVCACACVYKRASDCKKNK